jgi:hypothetical protein
VVKAGKEASFGKSSLLGAVCHYEFRRDDEYRHFPARLPVG